MSVAEAAHRPARTGRATALWLAFILLIAAAVGLAWIGAGSLRPEITSSGLQFRTIKAGKGDPITRADAALVDYVLTSDEGTVFDASQQPAPLAMDSVYPGFAEAMSRMQEGGEYRFTMPQGFPKNSNLTFEVRVRKIARGGAAMLQQYQAQQMQQQLQQQQQQAPQEQAPQQ
jgi:FKBP-type peptidyl-prolyl cis-trans isomerase FkpA